MDINLKGKNALVCGSSGGIGKATAIVLSQLGANVTLLSRNAETLGDALKELNEEQKQCVTLFYLQKKSYQQISDETGYSMLQVKSYIQNGKRNLKILIEKKLQEELNRK